MSSRKILIRRALFGALLSVVWMPTSAVPAQQKEPEQVVSQRINIAGRQRMLSQRMAKAICFYLSGTDSAAQREAAIAAVDEFNSQLEVLLNGSAELGFPPEADPETRQMLIDIRELSQPLTASVRQLAAGDINAFPVRYLIERNLPTLTLMNEAVGRIAKAAGQSSIDEDLATTINKAGRQRMLSQKIAKSACFISIRLDAANNVKELDAARTLFEETLWGLIVGDEEAGLLPPPNALIGQQLNKVAATWQEVSPILKRILETGDVAENDMLKLAHDLDVVLVEMNRAVGMWAAHKE